MRKRELRLCSVGEMRQKKTNSLKNRTAALSLTIVFPFAAFLMAQNDRFDGRPAVVLGNDKIELTILTVGATLANLTLRADSEKLSPFWNTDRALGRAPSGNGALGHFLCLDGFGDPSNEEKAAGWPAMEKRASFPSTPSSRGKKAGFLSLNLLYDYRSPRNP